MHSSAGSMGLKTRRCTGLRYSTTSPYISKVLLKAGTHLHRRDRRGASPLHIAASTGLPEIIEDFLEAGAALEALTVRGHSPLHMAVLKNSVHVSSLLLNTGASTEPLGAIHG